MLCRGAQAYFSRRKTTAFEMAFLYCTTDLYCTVMFLCKLKMGSYFSRILLTECMSETYIVKYLQPFIVYTCAPFPCLSSLFCLSFCV